MSPKPKTSKTTLHLALLISLLGMLLATVFTSYVIFREYQYKQNLTCEGLTGGFRQLRTDALSDDSQDYLRYKAIKLIATVYAEMRTGVSLENLMPSVMGVLMNDLYFMCSTYPDYKIGQIIRYDSDKYLDERSRFNREFTNMIGWQKVEQDYHIADIGQWLITESKK